MSKAAEGLLLNNIYQTVKKALTIFIDPSGMPLIEEVVVISTSLFVQKKTQNHTTMLKMGPGGFLYFLGFSIYIYISEYVSH